MRLNATSITEIMIHELQNYTYTTFFNYPRKYTMPIRTTNPVGSPFANVHLRTSAAKRFRKVENATAVLRKMLMIA